MKLAIVGSRKLNDYNKLCEFINKKYNIAEIDTIVSGGAKGADTLAEKFAADNNLKLIVKEAQWDLYGRAAGPKRNKLIVEEADCVVAFPTPSSTGTYNSMKLAKQMGKPLEVCYVQNDSE